MRSEFFRASSVSLRVALPRSQHVLSLRASPCYCFTAGDVEANPGPRTEDVLAVKNTFNTAYEEHLTGITAALKNIMQDVAVVKTRVTAIEQKMSSVPILEADITSFSGSVTEVKAAMSTTNADLSDVVGDFANGIRRNNVIVYKVWWRLQGMMAPQL